MDPTLLKFFQMQVKTQCQILLLAESQLQDARGALQAAAGANRLVPNATLGIFAAIQALLTAAANLSKALWGQGGPTGKKAADRKPLRDSLGVTDSSPLAPTDVRNSFDHFDDRLDTWWTSSPTKSFVDLNMLPLGSSPPVPQDNIFRHFDPRTDEVIFWGWRTNFRDLAAEARRILGQLQHLP